MAESIPTPTEPVPPVRTRHRNRPPFSVDLNTVPSQMEQHAARWSVQRDG